MRRHFNFYIIESIDLLFFVYFDFSSTYLCIRSCKIQYIYIHIILRLCDVWSYEALQVIFYIVEIHSPLRQCDLTLDSTCCINCQRNGITAVNIDLILNETIRMLYGYHELSYDPTRKLFLAQISKRYLTSTQRS